MRPGDSGLTITTANIQNSNEPHEIVVTVWGLPALVSHDPERGEECDEPAGKLECSNGGLSDDVPLEPYLTNPTSCGSSTAMIAADSWETSESFSSALTEVGPLTECERIPFDPSIDVQPTTNTVESPSGLDISLIVPQAWEDPFSVSTANVKDTELALPVGYTVNPSAGSGLGACTPAQYEAETSSSLPGAGCPAESKIGAVEVETPVLAEKLIRRDLHREAIRKPVRTRCSRCTSS